MSGKIDSNLFSSFESQHTQQDCPECAGTLKGHLHIRHGKHGPFLGCDQYPVCNYIQPIHKNDGHIIKALGVPCPECGMDEITNLEGRGELVLRQGRYGMFIACNRYPECHHIESQNQQPEVEESESIACPECQLSHNKTNGKLIERKSRYGKRFFACDAYPKCTFSSNLTPIIGSCSQCGFPLLVEKNLASGRKVLCADRKCQHEQEG